MSKTDKKNNGGKPMKMSRKAFERELALLEVELVKLQHWIKAKGLKPDFSSFNFVPSVYP